MCNIKTVIQSSSFLDQDNKHKLFSIVLNVHSLYAKATAKLS